MKPEAVGREYLPFQALLADRGGIITPHCGKYISDQREILYSFIC